MQSQLFFNEIIPYRTNSIFLPQHKYDESASYIYILHQNKIDVCLNYMGSHVLFSIYYLLFPVAYKGYLRNLNYETRIIFKSVIIHYLFVAYLKEKFSKYSISYAKSIRIVSRITVNRGTVQVYDSTAV